MNWVRFGLAVILIWLARGAQALAIDLVRAADWVKPRQMVMAPDGPVRLEGRK